MSALNRFIVNGEEPIRKALSMYICYIWSGTDQLDPISPQEKQKMWQVADKVPVALDVPENQRGF